MAVAAGFAIWETTRRMGPFAFQSITYSILSTQLYIAVSSISTLCLAAAVVERKALAERLAASRARLVEAADTERRRIEHNLHDGAQQRLTAIVVQLRLGADLARAEPARGPGLLDAAEAELQLAIDELRELAHGIHPTCSRRSGSRRRSRWSPRDRRSRSGCWSCRRPGSTRPPRRPRTSSPARP